MNKIELLSKLQTFFDADDAKKRKNVEEIEDVLVKLKSKLIKTKKKHLQCKNQEFKKALLLEVDVISAQIDKGEKVLKGLS